MASFLGPSPVPSSAPAEQLRLLGARRLDQPVGGLLDHRADADDEFAPRQAGRQGVEEFDTSVPG